MHPTSCIFFILIISCQYDFGILAQVSPKTVYERSYSRSVHTSKEGSMASPAVNQLKQYLEDTKNGNQKSGGFAQNQLGQKVPSLTASEAIAGIITLTDTNYIEHLAQFDRERIPERVVHAVGVGAFGTWKVTHDITKYTKACVFQPNTDAKILIRFSTVGGHAGSADLAHDPRGFAIKFYTKCGIWDLVGNNLETFPIRDPIFFPSLIRSRKQNPVTNMGDQNMWWDFTSLRPESTMHTIQLFSYLGFPDGLRAMDGAGVHTFKLVNKDGEAVYCKFHFISKNGYRNMTQAEAAMQAGSNPQYSQQDLYDAIERKDFPSWEFFVQIMTYEQAEASKFNPFDVTKAWDRSDFPLQPVGVFTLNKNPTNYFRDIETAAFDPGNLISGIEQSPDPMFIGRSFSYSDSQRYRLGPNFLQLPSNRPVDFEDLVTYQRDGQGNVGNNGGSGPNYFPNSFGGAKVDPDAKQSVRKGVSGDVERKDTGSDDNFSQPKAWFDSRSEAEQKAIASNIANALRPAVQHVQDQALANFEQVSPKLKENIVAGLKKPP